MNQYILTLKSDTGKVRIKTAATSSQAAKDIVTKSESCPLSAILSCWDLKFYNTDGTLNRYGLACGYIIRKESKTQWKELYHESDHFHVRSGILGQRFSIWETFSNHELTKARKLYQSIKI